MISRVVIGIVLISNLTLAVLRVVAAPREWQVVQDYVTLMDADPGTCLRLGMPMGQRINPFLSYTGIATDYGFLGPGEATIVCEPGHLCVRVEDAKWGGVWHSLAGLGADKMRWMDFENAYPEFIRRDYQPKITGLKLRGNGRGKLKVEVKASDQTMLWSDVWEMDHTEDQDFFRTLPMLHRAKFLNWISESGGQICLDEVALEVEMPELPDDMRIFLKSYAKLARCYSASSGLVKDRAHAGDGSFDSIPASGMFCLASAVAEREGIVAEGFAKKMLLKTAALISRIETASGLLPHFVQMAADGTHKIVAGTEYSSVDSAIYFHSMLIAAQILEDRETSVSLLEMIRRIRMNELLDSTGHVIHGINSDGTRIPASWQDWGGETALVLLFQHLALGDTASARMKSDGMAWQGTGFIPEIQSLLFPGFDSHEKDRISGQDWAMVRRSYASRQREYFKSLRGPLEKSGIFGLSAGEGRRGMGYLVSGTDLKDQKIVHPHYMLMAANDMENTAAAYESLMGLERIGAFPPWGLVENIDTETGEMLPMLGSLNASFEVLAAYHLMVRHRKQPDAIYDAVRANIDLTAALRVFYQ